MAKVDDIIRSFTEEQAAVYNAMLGDEHKLKADWTGCKKMYADAIKVINDKSTGPEVRLLLREVSDYWNRRKLAMERLLKATGKEALLQKWKEEYNG